MANLLFLGDYKIRVSVLWLRSVVLRGKNVDKPRNLEKSMTI